jgi:integrase/recombinase XerD
MAKIADYVEDWLATKSVRTAISYRNTLNQFVREVGTEFEEIKLGNNFRWLDKLDVADTTRNKHVNILKSFFSDMVRLDDCPITRSPFDAKHRRYSKGHKLAERILTQEEVNLLIGAMQGVRDRVLVETLYFAGLRVSELTGLTWQNCIRMTNVDKLVVTGKGEYTREIPIPSELMDRIFRLKSVGAKRNDYVFQSYRGKKLGTSDVRYLLRQAAQRAELAQWDKISAHWLRHANATHALENGAPIHIVQNTLGHKSLSTTSKYLHVHANQSSSAYLNLKATSFAEDGWAVMDLNDIPAESGVYAFKQGERWLYVGKANSIQKRLNKWHLPFAIAQASCPGVQFLYRLSENHHRLERELLKELNPEWNGGTDYERDEANVRYLYGGWGLSCLLMEDTTPTYWQTLEDLIVRFPSRAKFLDEHEIEKIRRLASRR